MRASKLQTPGRVPPTSTGFGTGLRSSKFHTAGGSTRKPLSEARSRANTLGPTSAVKAAADPSAKALFGAKSATSGAGMLPASAAEHFRIFVRVKKQDEVTPSVFHPAVGLGYLRRAEAAARPAINLCTDQQYMQGRLEACGIPYSRDSSGLSAGAGSTMSFGSSAGGGASGAVSSAASVVSGGSGTASSGSLLPVPLDRLPPAPAPPAGKFFKEYASLEAVFDGEAGQGSVFNGVCTPLIKAAGEGQNVAVICYGQTGSGKTYTMMGTPEHPGLCPLMLASLLQSKRAPATAPAAAAATATAGAAAPAGLTTSEVELEVLEVYGNDAFDLLQYLALREELLASLGPRRKPSPKQMEELYDACRRKVTYLSEGSGSAASSSGAGRRDFSVRVEGVQSSRISSVEEGTALLQAVFEARRTNSTAMNAASSRSHVLVYLRVTSTTTPAHAAPGAGLGADGVEGCYDDTAAALAAPVKRTSLVVLADLAGSEKARDTKSSGEALAEGCAINLGLSALTACVLARSSQEKAKRSMAALGGEGGVPWRQHILTQLLRPVLDGSRSRASFIITLDPRPEHCMVTRDALDFGVRAGQISVRAAAPEDVARMHRQAAAAHSARVAAAQRAAAEARHAMALAAAGASAGGMSSSHGALASLQGSSASSYAIEALLGTGGGVGLPEGLGLPVDAAAAVAARERLHAAQAELRDALAAAAAAAAASSSSSCAADARVQAGEAERSLQQLLMSPPARALAAPAAGSGGGCGCLCSPLVHSLAQQLGATQARLAFEQATVSCHALEALAASHAVGAGASDGAMVAEAPASSSQLASVKAAALKASASDNAPAGGSQPGVGSKRRRTVEVAAPAAAADGRRSVTHDDSEDPAEASRDGEEEADAARPPSALGKQMPAPSAKRQRVSDLPPSAAYGAGAGACADGVEGSLEECCGVGGLDAPLPLSPRSSVGSCASSFRSSLGLGGGFSSSGAGLHGPAAGGVGRFVSAHMRMSMGLGFGGLPPLPAAAGDASGQGALLQPQPAAARRHTGSSSHSLASSAAFGRTDVALLAAEMADAVSEDAAAASGAQLEQALQDSVRPQQARFAAEADRRTAAEARARGLRDRLLQQRQAEVASQAALRRVHAAAGAVEEAAAAASDALAALLGWAPSAAGALQAALASNSALQAEVSSLRAQAAVREALAAKPAPAAVKAVAPVALVAADAETCDTDEAAPPPRANSWGAGAGPAVCLDEEGEVFAGAPDAAGAAGQAMVEDGAEGSAEALEGSTEEGADAALEQVAGDAAALPLAEEAAPATSAAEAPVVVGRTRRFLALAKLVGTASQREGAAAEGADGTGAAAAAASAAGRMRDPYWNAAAARPAADGAAAGASSAVAPGSSMRATRAVAGGLSSVVKAVMSVSRAMQAHQSARRQDIAATAAADSTCGGDATEAADDAVPRTLFAASAAAGAASEGSENAAPTAAATSGKSVALNARALERRQRLAALVGGGAK